MKLDLKTIGMGLQPKEFPDRCRQTPMAAGSCGLTERLDFNGRAGTV